MFKNNTLSFKSIKTYLICLVIILLVVQSLSSFAIGITTTNTRINKEKIGLSLKNSFIIEFKDESILSFRGKIKNFFSNSNILKGNFLKDKVEQYKSKLDSMHLKAKLDILNILGSSYRIKDVFTHDFKLFSNSIVIKNIPNDVIDSIKSLDYVKNIRVPKKIKIQSDPISWGVSKINADKVWNLHDTKGREITGEGISIAIIDTGIDYDHSLLGGGFGLDYTVVDGDDFVEFNRYDEENEVWFDKLPEDDHDPDDENGHGTHCAGIALGVAPGASLYAYRVLNKDGWGNESWLESAMTRAVDPNGDFDTSDHVDIISLSFGTVSEGDPNDNMSKWVNQAVDCGVTVVAAAGNNGSDYHTISSPGCAEKAITVGNSNSYDRVDPSSSRGPTLNGKTKPDLVAPGMYIESTWLNNGFATLSGTSMSTPHVSGAAALLLQLHPNLSPKDIKDRLKQDAVKLFASNGSMYDEYTQGAGRINILKSINLSDAPPIADLDISQYLKKGKIKINGTAMNGTGNSSDFANFSLYYKYDNDWIELCTKSIEVKNSVLYEWDTTDFEKGLYKLKLFVRSKDQASFDIKDINIGYDGLIIECDEIIEEQESFKVDIMNINKEPVDCFVVFMPRFHLPQIKYGSTVQFKGPRMYNPLKQNISGKIFAIKLLQFEKKVKKIEIINIE